MDEQPSKQPRLNLVWVLALVLLLGVLDYLTGPQISFFAFYLVPVSLAAWSSGRKAGIAVSGLCAGSWLIANAQGLPTLGHPAILYWNCLVRFATYVFVVALITRRPPVPKTDGQLLLEDFRRHKQGLGIPTDIPLRISDTLDWLVPLLLILNILVLGGMAWYFGYLKPR
jgi:hypothetical protein